MSQSTPAGPTGPGYDPTTPYPAPARRSWFARHKVLTVLGALVVLVIAAAIASGGGDDEPGAAPGPAATADQPGAPADQPGNGSADQPGNGSADQPADEPDAGIGTPVRDGKFEFTVTQIETGVPRVGDDLFGQDAQGRFVLLHVTVTNIGTEAQYFDGSSQKLLDTAGRTHSADSAAAIYLGDTESFLNQINPGNTVDGIVVFDVPADAVPAAAELHDSPFSGGVTVALG